MLFNQITPLLAIAPKQLVKAERKICTRGEEQRSPAAEKTDN
jgi:hypothetical protein